MALKPWYKVITPREDLRNGRPLDASEFAVHLDHIRDGHAHEDYQDAERFFDRTHLTKNLTGLAAEVVRRLSGEKTETSAVFNMATQFGGGKTHALTLLYHLARTGPEAVKLRGVPKILERAKIEKIPKAQVAVFVGSEFDSLKGRGGDDGTPRRKTPWGEIAFQLGGAGAFEIVAVHEEKQIAPGGEVIRRLFPNDRPCLILMDEILNYVSRYRKQGLASQFYDFLQNLSETARGESNVVLAVSVPESELEMSADDQQDHERLKNLLDRLGKAVMIAAEEETSEIIRRRLFEWSVLPQEAQNVATEYADWIQDHRHQVPSWFPVDSGRDAIVATYPFHPTVLSLFERKWQSLPRFQRTRGILRLLALWVSNAYEQGFKGAQKDPLIGLGSAPLDDPQFRAAVFEQLGEDKLEAAVTTDICGKKDSHAIRLDKEDVEAIRQARLHRQVATTIFFESNGGQTRAEATAPEIRLAVASPQLDIGNVETVLENLTGTCYYLVIERNKYRFSLKPNLNKILADRRAGIKDEAIDEQVKAETQKVFAEPPGVARAFFPEKSVQIADRTVITFCILSTEYSMLERSRTLAFIEAMTKEHGNSARTYKNALVWCVAENDSTIQEAARDVLAWEAIEDEKESLKLDSSQQARLAENLRKARRDLRESVWRTYKYLVFLAKDNTLKVMDLGLVNSSAAANLTTFLFDQLRQSGDAEKRIGENFLVKHWPPVFTEWSTKSVRDACFASPQFPKLINPDSLRETIASGVANKVLAYVGKASGGGYEPFYFGKTLNPDEVEISDEMYIITADEAKKHIEPPRLASLVVAPGQVTIAAGKKQTFVANGLDQHGRGITPGKVEWKATGGAIDAEGTFSAGSDEGNFVVTAASGSISATASVTIAKPGAPPPPPPPPPPPTGKRIVQWSGEVPSQKWMNFYTKVLTRYAARKEAKLRLDVSFSAEGDISEQNVEETKTALRELGLGDQVDVKTGE